MSTATATAPAPTVYAELRAADVIDVLAAVAPFTATTQEALYTQVFSGIFIALPTLPNIEPGSPAPLLALATDKYALAIATTYAPNVDTDALGIPTDWPHDTDALHAASGWYSAPPRTQLISALRRATGGTARKAAKGARFTVALTPDEGITFTGPGNAEPVFMPHAAPGTHAAYSTLNVTRTHLSAPPCEPPLAGSLYNPVQLAKFAHLGDSPGYSDKHHPRVRISYAAMTHYASPILIAKVPTGSLLSGGTSNAMLMPIKE